MTMTNNEDLGRLVRDVWIEWAQEQPTPKPSWLVCWENLAPQDKEVDMRIGKALYDAGFEAGADSVK
jgi:hypothetical protein